MTWPPKKPEPFLSIVVKRLDIKPLLTTLCAGYETGQWRAEGLAAHLLEWLPQFALKREEYLSLDGANMVRVLVDVARRIYLTDKYKRRGEFGELLLYVAIRQEFNTIPIVSKCFYKSSANETVKGFDGVHIVAGDDGLELWLGEAKLYEDITAAMKSAVADLKAHTMADYLKSEFAVIHRKIDDNMPYAQDLKKLLDKNTSLDVVFKRICIPILLTYDSNAVGTHSQTDAAYLKAIEEESLENHAAFLRLKPALQLRVILFLVPMANLKLLREKLEVKLKALQAVG